MLLDVSHLYLPPRYHQEASRTLRKARQGTADETISASRFAYLVDRDGQRQPVHPHLVVRRCRGSRQASRRDDGGPGLDHVHGGKAPSSARWNTRKNRLMTPVSFFPAGEEVIAAVSQKDHGRRPAPVFFSFQALTGLLVEFARAVFLPCLLVRAPRLHRRRRVAACRRP